MRLYALAFGIKPRNIPPVLQKTDAYGFIAGIGCPILFHPKFLIKALFIAIEDVKNKDIRQAALRWRINFRQTLCRRTGSRPRANAYNVTAIQ